MNELYERLRALTGKDLPPQRGPGKPGEQLRSSVDNGKAAEYLGWRPEVDLDSGLRETLEFFGAL